MKKDTHPNYKKILFVDSATGHKFVCGSTAETSHVETFEGKEYPTIHMPISSSSHPYFVGGKGIVDTEGRVDKFTKKYQMAQQKAAAKDAQVKEEKLEAEKPKRKSKKA